MKQDTHHDAFTSTSGYLRFHPRAQCVVHAFKARLAASVSLRRDYPVSAQVAFAPRARLRQSFSRTMRLLKMHILNGSKTKAPHGNAHRSCLIISCI
jgi:hypothetical protein